VDAQGKTLGAGILTMEIEVREDDLAAPEESGR
jgi:hypothetical protein